LDDLRKNLKLYKLAVTNLNANTVVGWYGKRKVTSQFEPSLSNNKEKLRKWRVNYTKMAIDLANELGSPSVSITSGIIQGSSPAHMYNLKRSIEEITDYAEQKNVLIAIEYEPGLLLGSSNDVYSILNGHRNLGINLDVCHAAVLGEDIRFLIKKFRKKIFHTHISDCKNSIHYHLIPGLGEIDFRSIYDMLDNVNYKGYLTAELYPYFDEPEKAAKEALNHFMKFIN
ncbi:MAG: sugar phosphate isomerase/epimerase family protein, partial [Nitrosopumilaceae archaeon]